MRRRPGTLLPIEIEILRATAGLGTASEGGIHGFALAKLLRAGRGQARLTAHGTLYKALGRLAAAGLLRDQWESAEVALAEGRPRRRLYRITASGQRALAEASIAKSAGRTTDPGTRIAPA